MAGGPSNERHPGSAGRVEVELLRREVAGVTVPERTLVLERPDGSIYLFSGGRGERSRIALTSCRASRKRGMESESASAPPLRARCQRICGLQSTIRNLPNRNPNVLFPLFAVLAKIAPPAQLNTRALFMER
jgi:hypothetical protein